MKEERKSEIMVEVIDDVKFLSKLDRKKANLPDGVNFKFFETQGIVRTKNGTFILNTEGVGSSVPIEQKKVELGMTRDDRMSIMPEWIVKFNADDLKDVPISEKINLADFIRSFGERLESNFRKWDSFLTKQGI